MFRFRPSYLSSRSQDLNDCGVQGLGATVSGVGLRAILRRLLYLKVFVWGSRCRAWS